MSMIEDKEDGAYKFIPSKIGFAQASERIRLEGHYFLYDLECFFVDGFQEGEQIEYVF